MSGEHGLTSEPPQPVTEPQAAARREAAESTRVTQAGESTAILLAEEVDRVSHGQRRINLLWERTQAIIALSVVEVSLAVGAVMILRDAGGLTGPGTTAGSPGSLAFVFLASVANLVIGFYFGRTNHQRIGGVGAQTPSEVLGR